MALRLECERNVAFDSPDHIHPYGTMQNNFSNIKFIERLTRLYNFKPIKILDMGCSGGGFVKDCSNFGHDAYGVEGSDYSLKVKRAEWRTIPERLFTCDITRNFQFYDNDNKIFKFDFITAWDVMEHIKESDLPALCANVRENMNDGALWVMSVANYSSSVDGVEFHLTQQPKTWWVEMFRKNGLYPIDDYVEYFSPYFVRGNREKKTNFHLAVSNSKTPPVKLIKKSAKRKLLDNMLGLWVGSLPHQVINEFISMRPED